MDKIFLTDLKVDTIIGIYEWERNTTQTLQFDLEFDWDIQTAAASDDIKDTLDYGAVAEVLVNFVQESRYQLIETLAESVCRLLLERFPIGVITLSLTKPVKLHGQNFARIQITRHSR